MGVEGIAPECQETQGGRASREGQSGSPKPGLTKVIAAPLGSVHSSCRKKGRDTVGELKSAEMGVSNMPSWKAKKLGKLTQEKVLLELW